MEIKLECMMSWESKRYDTKMQRDLVETNASGCEDVFNLAKTWERMMTTFLRSPGGEELMQSPPLLYYAPHSFYNCRQAQSCQSFGVL